MSEILKSNEYYDMIWSKEGTIKDYCKLQICRNITIMEHCGFKYKGILYPKMNKRELHVFKKNFMRLKRAMRNCKLEKFTTLIGNIFVCLSVRKDGDRHEEFLVFQDRIASRYLKTCRIQREADVWICGSKNIKVEKEYEMFKSYLKGITEIFQNERSRIVDITGTIYGNSIILSNIKFANNKY